MDQVPNHPYAWFAARRTSPFELWLDFRCTFCGDETRYRCSRPQLQNKRILQYARMHGHGVVPRPRRIVGS